MTASTATLSWAPSTDDVGVLGYNVYRFDGWFTSTLVATVPGTTYTAALPRRRRCAPCTTCGPATRPATCRSRPTRSPCPRRLLRRPRRPRPAG
ncbi:hypothetical protein V2I01_26385 [Micromonospora sp. BRA006-A]|nr:hypothetical protein [Micromonospora sp. BRA006-A]